MATKDTKTERPRRARAPESRRLSWIAILAAFALLLLLPGFLGLVTAQRDVSDADLQTASGGRTVRVGSVQDRGRVMTVPLEVYVARVVAGEGERQAADAAYQALAVAIRTYALANAGRHAREGFDLCDSTHCQVPRVATPAARRAALATAGQILIYRGRPAEVFYSASCGGRSASAADVWPGADLPYLTSARDDVHEHDEPWSIELSLPDIQRALAPAGFAGQRLRDVRIEARSASGRAARLSLPGLAPDEITGDQFRAVIGANVLRSTAFSVSKHGNRLRFTGRGFGHGVGLCVIGAGRRANRGDSAAAILRQYYPGLELSRGGAAAGDAVTAVSGPSVEAPAGRRGIVVRVPRSSTVAPAAIEVAAARAHEELSARLGTSVTPITIQLHESIESFRLATGRPWWVSASSTGSSIDLAPVAVLAQRGGVDAALRVAIADLLVSGPLSGRPAWVRVGAARYFGRQPSPAALSSSARVRCPSDAELTLAVSATAQREAEMRAEACFARAVAANGDWRVVR